MQNNIDHDIPSAPPLSGSSPIDRVSERTSGADAKPSLRTSGGSSTKVEPNMNKNTNFGATEVNSADAVRYTFGAFVSPSYTTYVSGL